MHERFDVAVIGGGPAGTAAAISAARRGKTVVLLEAGRYPRHKVCGEFVSAESLQLLKSLLRETPGVELLERAPRVSRVEVHLAGGSFESPITPAAASIARYDLDHALWKAAIANGVDAREGVGRLGIKKQDGGFVITSKPSVQSDRLIYGAGRRSDRAGVGPALVGIKAHFRPSEPLESVGLYFGATGYCGVQPVAEGLVNVCALVVPDALKNIGWDRMRAAFEVHPELRRRQWEQVTETVATGTCVFTTPEPLTNGIECAGDAAGFIDPFLGDGISLALQSGELAGSLEDAGEYEREYRRRFLPLFRRAARLRRLLRAPSAVQKAALLIMRYPPFGAAVVAATRVKSGDPAHLGYKPLL